MDSGFYLRGKNNEEVLGRRLGSKEEDEEEEEGLRVGRNEEEEEGEIYQNHTHSSHSNSRRRKGIPQRAPF